jgi:signal transduction histidine kinase/CheY-like chemotaxis protein
MSPITELARWAMYQQDYFWFLVGVGWASAGLGWWRFFRRTSGSSWLPWASGLGVATAVIELSHLITPVMPQPGVAPWLSWDIAVGITQAALAAGLWWLAWREGHSGWYRWIGYVIATGVVVFAPLRLSHPVAGSWLTAVTLTVAVLSLILRNAECRKDAGVLLLIVAANWCSTVGPLAEALDMPHRFSEFSPLGPWSALLQIAAILLLGRNLLRAQAADDVADANRAWMRLLQYQILWLSAGLVLAYVMGRWARVNFEQNVLSRVQLAAQAIDRDLLAAGFDGRFRVEGLQSFSQPNGDVSYMARSDHAARVLLPVAESLHQIELAMPDCRWAIVQTLRGGWLVAGVVSTQQPGDRAEFGLYRRALPVDLLDWTRASAWVEGPVELYYGAAVQARIPLRDSGGRMLGWLALDFTPSHWLANQVHARVLAFAVIALGSLLLLVDVLRRQQEKQGEAARRRAEIAQAADQMKAAFLAKVSHELRTPIQSLLGYSELLRQRVADDTKAAGWLASLRQHGELMTRLVNDLVDLGAVESGSFRLTPRAIEPEGLVRQTVESLRIRADQKSLTLACFVDPGVPAWLSLDGERFRQVLTNLVGNAIKFTDRGGVTVAMRAEADHRLVLVVRDTGPGIPPAEQGRLFVPFSRLELTADKEGSGLGLALSAALCRAMGGDLIVASDGTTGSCFTATFHGEPLVLPPPTHETEPAISLRGQRILVVDDNPLVRELFVAYLTDQGAMCAAAASGAEALAQAGTMEFNSIILDFALPDGDGTEFVQPLRERADGARIIGVSAHAGAAERARALAAGMDLFLTKPVSLSSLGAAVGGVQVAASFRTADALRERLSRQFVRDLPAQRDAIDAAIAAADWPLVRSLAHYLKNSAVVIRDDTLFSICTGLENAATEADVDAVRRWRGQAEDALNRWLAGSPMPPISPAASPADNLNPKQT